MNNWHTFLQQQGATILGEGNIFFTESTSNYPSLQKSCTLSPLIHLGIIALEGPDTKRFLQGQVTCDVLQLTPDLSMLGARCNPKGRMLTNFQLHELRDQQLLMVMDRSLITQTIDELSKFAAFFKVQLTDASEQYQLIGVANFPVDRQEKIPTAASTYRYKDGRQLLIVPEEQAQSLWIQLSEKATAVGTEFWILQDIQAGLGTLQTETSDMFIPQMLNLQALEAISFKKGCYTGQEIVARMKYLGKLKRKMYRATIQGGELPSSGTACYLPGQEQSIGNVVKAVHADENSMELLLVLTETAPQGNQLIIGHGDIQSIQYQSLPYDADL